MVSLFEHYKVLGVNYGAGLNDVTSSYKRLCRIHHPDVNDDPESEEIMKRINLAYTVLREKFKRDAALRERQNYSRPVKRYGPVETRHYGAETRTQNTDARKAAAEAEKAAYAVLDSYFKAINAYDYSAAYILLSNLDKRSITREGFIKWRQSVARLYPMREFRITGGQPVSTVVWGVGKTMFARKFRVAVTEEDLTDDEIHSGNVEKMVINENGIWKVYLGYNGVGELTRTFDEQFKTKWKRDVAKRWDEYFTGLYPEFNMLSLSGMSKAVSRELYRQRRFGGTLTFAVMSIKAGGTSSAGQEQLLRSAAKTIGGALRETDIPAYAGDGVFAILLVELRKKNAGEIMGRLAGNIRKNAGPQLGTRAEIEVEHITWSAGGNADINTLNAVLKKFQKKM